MVRYSPSDASSIKLSKDVRLASNDSFSPEQTNNDERAIKAQTAKIGKHGWRCLARAKYDKDEPLL